MTICLNEKIVQNNSMTMGEVLLLLAIHYKSDMDKAHIALIEKGYITAQRNQFFIPDGWKLTNLGTEILNTIIIDSDKHQEPTDRLVSLASSLKEVFPKGKKDGTSTYWAEGNALIVRRLKLFFKKYGNEYTDEQIITAAKKYIQSFNGINRYMRTLKYFIFAEKVNANGEVEGTSDLITFIENAGEENSLGNDWSSTLI